LIHISGIKNRRPNGGEKRQTKTIMMHLKGKERGKGGVRWKIGREKGMENK
jgi:hypothetical protein